MKALSRILFFLALVLFLVAIKYGFDVQSLQDSQFSVFLTAIGSVGTTIVSAITQQWLMAIFSGAVAFSEVRDAFFHSGNLNDAILARNVSGGLAFISFVSGIFTRLSGRLLELIFRKRGDVMGSVATSNQIVCSSTSPSIKESRKSKDWFKTVLYLLLFSVIVFAVFFIGIIGVLIWAVFSQ